jgi:hypothetical protein
MSWYSDIVNNERTATPNRLFLRLAILSTSNLSPSFSIPTTLLAPATSFRRYSALMNILYSGLTCRANESLRLGHGDACAKHRSSFPHRGFTGPKRYAIAIPYVSAPRKIIEQLAHKRHVQNGGRPQCGLDDDVRGDAVGYEAVLLDE